MDANHEREASVWDAATYKSDVAAVCLHCQLEFCAMPGTGCAAFRDAFHKASRDSSKNRHKEGKKWDR